MHDQVSFHFMTRELSTIYLLLSLFFYSYFKQNRIEEEEEIKTLFDSLYNCQFRLVLDIQWPDHDCMLMMIMITPLTGHR